jgi:hypothetical protein
MAKRHWSLPNIEALTKSQERARLLPKEGCHLIVGGPGTGKSVVAMLRTRRLHNAKGAQEYVFLVYNRLLLDASRELVNGAVNAHPWKAWFRRLYKDLFARPCPTLNGQFHDLDWATIASDVYAFPGEIPPPRTPFLVIDEGQDMPPQFYQVLTNLGYEHFYVVADPNQQITEQNSRPDEIEQALDIHSKDRIEFTDNYRNCDLVARLALAFCVADPSSPCIQLPKGRRCPKIPALLDYGDHCRWDFNEVVRRILKLADRDPSELTAVFTPNNNARLRWFNALKQMKVALDHGPPRILTYASGQEESDHRFSEGGIFVINAQAAKGLEFENVFIADINEFPCRLDDPVWMNGKRRLFYVLISRARKRAVLLRQAGRRCPIDAILPQDETILRHWS